VGLDRMGMFVSHVQMMNDTPNSRALEYIFGEGAEKPPTSFIIAKSQLKEIFYTDWDSEVPFNPLTFFLIDWFRSFRVVILKSNRKPTLKYHCHAFKTLKCITLV